MKSRIFCYKGPKILHSSILESNLYSLQITYIYVPHHCFRYTNKKLKRKAVIKGMRQSKLIRCLTHLYESEQLVSMNRLLFFFLHRFKLFKTDNTKLRLHHHVNGAAWRITCSSLKHSNIT